MHHDLDQQLTDISARQHGLIATRQVREAGFSRAAWRHRLSTGEWEPVSGRVARRTGTPRTTDQRLLAAVLDQGPDAYISHRSGAAMWGLPGYRSKPVEAMVVRGHHDRSSALAIVHRPRHLPEPFAAEINGIPVVRPALVLLQLAPSVSAERLKRMLDHLWNRRLLSGPSVARELAGVMHRGRAGTVALRELLDSLPPDYVPPASALEGRFAQLVVDAGLPEMRRQVDLGGEDWCGRVDFVDARMPLVVEVDSERYHAALTSAADDALRQKRLERAGFHVVRFTDFQIWYRGREVIETLQAARRKLQPRAA